MEKNNNDLLDGILPTIETLDLTNPAYSRYIHYINPQRLIEEIAPDLKNSFVFYNRGISESAFEIYGYNEKTKFWTCYQSLDTHVNNIIIRNLEVCGQVKEKLSLLNKDDPECKKIIASVNECHSFLKNAGQVSTLRNIVGQIEKYIADNFSVFNNSNEMIFERMNRTILPFKDGTCCDFTSDGLREIRQDDYIVDFWAYQCEYRDEPFEALDHLNSIRFPDPDDLRDWKIWMAVGLYPSNKFQRYHLAYGVSGSGKSIDKNLVAKVTDTRSTKNLQIGFWTTRDDGPQTEYAGCHGKQFVYTDEGKKMKDSSDFRWNVLRNFANCATYDTNDKNKKTQRCIMPGRMWFYANYDEFPKLQDEEQDTSRLLLLNYPITTKGHEDFGDDEYKELFKAEHSGKLFAYLMPELKLVHEAKAIRDLPFSERFWKSQSMVVMDSIYKEIEAQIEITGLSSDGFTMEELAEFIEDLNPFDDFNYRKELPSIKDKARACSKAIIKRLASSHSKQVSEKKFNTRDERRNKHGLCGAKLPKLSSVGFLKKQSIDFTSLDLTQ